MMFAVVPFILCVTGLAFAADVLGMVATPLGLFLALGFLAFGTAAAPRVRRRARPWLLALGIPALALGLALLGLSPDERVNRLISLAVILGAVGIIFRAAGRHHRTLLLAASVSLFAGLFFLVLRWSPPAWRAWDGLSIAASGLAGATLAPSYSGFNVTVIVVIAAVVVYVSGANSSRARLAGALLCVFAALAVYIVRMAFLPGYEPAPEGSTVPGPSPLLVRHIPWNMPAILFLSQLPALLIVGLDVRLRPVRVPPRDRRGLAWAASLGTALLLAVAVLVVRTPERRHEGVPRVVFYEKGFINWASPDFKSFGGPSSGMLGRLPAFLRLYRFDPVIAPTLDDNTLAGARAVVVFTPVEIMDRTVRDRLYAFVERGGSLLVVAEHTWKSERGEDVFNDLLEPTAIRVNFDSAHYQIGGWLYSFGYSPTPLYRGLRQDLVEPGVGIGASLKVGPGAVPLLTGTHGYSDAGPATPAGGLGVLGDMHYAPGERLGDVVLAAEQRFGKGRVIVLGDTTPFFNMLMIGAHEMVARLFERLCSPPAERHEGVRLAAALVLIAGALVVFVLYRRRAALPIIALALAAGFLAQWQESREARAVEAAPRGRFAVVDASHANGFSRETWREDSLAGLFLNLMRNDVQPILARELSPSTLEGARMLFIISPLRRFTAGETRDVLRFIDAGGWVIVSVDHSSAEAVAPLLDHFKMRVRNTPLGPFLTNLMPAGGNVRFRVGWVVEDKSGKSQTLAAYADPRTAPAMLLRPADSLGTTGRRGGLLLIGDGQFFYDKNLEADKDVVIMENVAFLQWLSGYCAGGAEESRP